MNQTQQMSKGTIWLDLQIRNSPHYVKVGAPGRPGGQAAVLDRNG